MTYRRKNKCRPDVVYWNCHGHEEPQEQRIKKMSNFNFQTRNKTRLIDSNTRTQELKVKTQDVQDKCENLFLLC